MESYRTRYSSVQLSVMNFLRYSKDKSIHRVMKSSSIGNSGIALLQAILISALGLLVLAGIYFALTKFLSSSQTIKTYASVRDAAIGGVEYAVSVFNNNNFYFNTREALDKPMCFDANSHSGDSWTEESYTPISLKFKLYGSDTVFINYIYLCIAPSYEQSKGSEVSGVAYSQTSNPSSASLSNLTVLIISDATGPNNTKSKIQATYLPGP